MTDTFPDWLSILILWYVLGVGIVGVILSTMTFFREHQRWEESRNTTRTCTRNIILKIPLRFLIAMTWPFLLAFVIFCRLPRKVYRKIARLCGLPQHGEEAIDVRQCVKIWTPGKWQRRGWIVMMRARHQRSLLRAAKSWLPWSNFRRPKPRLKRTAGAAVSSTFEPESGAQAAEAGTPTISEIELAEAGRSDRRFAQVVTAVVEIEEEGLFRSIITYI